MPQSPTVEESSDRQAATTWLYRLRLAAWSISCHVGEVVGDALLILKKPASLLLALLATISLALLVLSSALDSLAGVAIFDPCKWPFASRVLSACTSPQTDTSVDISQVPLVPIQHADFPSLIELQHRAFDEFLGYSHTGSDLAVNLKHAELAVQDLIVLVKASKLTVKEELARALTDFVVDAKSAARGLAALSTRISGTVDDVLSYNDFTLRTLESTTSDDSRSSLALAFWSSMNGFSLQITGVLVHAAATSVSLDRLEERLLAIHALCMEEAIITAHAHDDLLWTLWTLLGGNREQLRDLTRRISVLRSVWSYRDTAVAYVAATTHSLHAVEADLAGLRERLGTGRHSGEVEIPLEVQIASIQRGVQRLQQEKSKGGVNEIEARV